MTSRPATVRRRLLEHALFWFGLVVFGLCCLAWSLLASALYRLLPRERGARLGQLAIRTGFRLYLDAMEAIGVFRCDLEALDALLDEPGLVIAPNHPSLLDAVVVISRLPRVVCITKSNLWDSPFLGGSVRLAGYLRNSAPLNLVREARRGLAAGQQLLVFPEGTRSTERPMGPFKGGFLLMARAAQAPVQTVFLDYDSCFLGKDWPLFRKPPLPVVVRARLGRRFEVGSDLHHNLAELERYYRGELIADASEAVLQARG